MASTATTRNRLEKQGAGENANTWGAPKLNNLFDQTDASLDGWTVKALTGDVTLTSVNFTADEARQRVLKFTGAGPFTVTIPAVEKWYVVWNACSAALTITTGSGLTGVVEPTEISLLICDGTNVRALGADAKSIKAYVDAAILASGGLPAQAGNAGKALTTNGTTASWGQLGATGIADGGISGIKLASGAAVANIGFPPLNRNGDTVQGNLGVNGYVSRALPALASTASSVATANVAEASVGSNGIRVRDRFQRLANGTDWTTAAYEIVLDVDGTAQHVMRLDPISTGRFITFHNEAGIGLLATFSTNGNFTAVGVVSGSNITSTSDARLKDNIETIADPLGLVAALRGVTWTWKKDGRPDIGLIAQEVEAVLPQLVHTDEDTGFKTLAYGNFIGVLVEALKKLEARVYALEGVVQP